MTQACIGTDTTTPFASLGKTSNDDYLLLINGIATLGPKDMPCVSNDGTMKVVFCRNAPAHSYRVAVALQVSINGAAGQSGRFVAALGPHQVLKALDDEREPDSCGLLGHDSSRHCAALHATLSSDGFAVLIVHLPLTCWPPDAADNLKQFEDLEPVRISQFTCTEQGYRILRDFIVGNIAPASRPKSHEPLALRMNAAGHFEVFAAMDLGPL